MPGNWSNPPGGSWSRPPGGQHSDPPGWSDPPGGDWSDPPGSPRLVGMGYHPDLPDHRDHGWQEFLGYLEGARAGRNARVKDRATFANDASEWPNKYNLGDAAEHPLPPVEDQGRTNSCTAQAAAGLIEYLYRWATGTYNDFSRMFIYYNSRKLLGWSGDTGAYIRTTFKAMRVFGVPPEPEWPFVASLLDAEPLPYHYAYAGNFKTMNYARLDSYGDPPDDLYQRIKQTVLAGYPVEFGFPVYGCIQNMQNYVIPVPSATDELIGGHAVLAVGYDDGVVYGKDKDGNDLKCRALIIRNSWGADWGEHGYGFLPFWYVEKGCASDFWTAYDKEWPNLDVFR